MITAIASAFGGVSGAPGEPGQIFNSINNALGVGAGSIGLGATGDPALPGAYICYMVFDVNKSFTGQGGYYRVTSAGNLAKELIAIPQVTIEQPGYIYVCVYNRSDSPNWVYFDDMKVTHAHSPVVAGADYFPFGLPMEGREITQEDYRWGYQGQYAEEDTVTGWNQFQLRMYDARFGRWLSVDPYGQFSSPYVAMGNAPNMYSDPDGGFCCGGVLPELVVTAARVTLGTIGEIILTSAATRLFLTAAEAQLNMNFYENKIGDGGKYGSGLDKGWETELTTEPTPVPRVISRPDPFTVAKQDLPGLISKLPSAETVQTVASIAGLIPGANTVAGIIEAGAALAAGDYAGAIFAGITAIPVIGVGVRWGKLLMQAHHVIPKAVIAKYGLKALRGFKSEAMKNIKRLPFPFHAWHPQYNKYVGNQIDKLGPLLNVEKLGELQNHLKREIRNAWRVHKQGNARTLNEYFRELNKTQ